MFVGNTFVYFVFRGKDQVESGQRQLVIWTLSAIALGGLVVMIFFRKPPEKDRETGDIPQPPAGPLEALKGAVRLFFTRNMLMLCVTFLYTGEMTFLKPLWQHCNLY